MEATTSDDTPRLIDYMVLCGVRPGSLVDYVSKLDESALSAGLAKDVLKQHGIIPEVLSRYPMSDKKSFPLSTNFVDVSP